MLAIIESAKNYLLSLFSTCVLQSIYSVEGEVKGQTEHKVCDGCGTELMVKDDGSHFMFCHSCGKNCSENGKSLGRSNIHGHGSDYLITTGTLFRQ